MSNSPKGLTEANTEQAPESFCQSQCSRVKELVPDATTLLNFRHLLEQHQLSGALFAKIGKLPQANGMKLSGGPIVDATLIAAPPSTKNREEKPRSGHASRPSLAMRHTYF